MLYVNRRVWCAQEVRNGANVVQDGGDSNGPFTVEEAIETIGKVHGFFSFSGSFSFLMVRFLKR